MTLGEIFWYITKGDINNGMPSWATLPRQRWQIVSYVKSLVPQHPKSSRQEAAPPVATKLNAPPPPPVYRLPI